MSNPNGRKGNGFEVDSMKYLRSRRIDTERLRLAGVLDEGDLVAKIGGIPQILQCKNVRQQAWPAWLREVQFQAGNYAEARGINMPGFWVVKKQPNRPISEAIIATYLSEWANQLDSTPF